MLGKLFVLLCRVPFLRKKLWGSWYEYLARKHRGPDWVFMNYGFHDTNASHLALESDDEANRSCIQLYRHVAVAHDLRGLKVLEVGSGRGGGASYVARYLAPARMFGVDLSQSAVEFCRTVHRIPNLEFRQGDAEHLPFEDASFDAVLNVESSHCYPSLPSFFTEVRRVLKSNGYFLYADLHDASTANEWRATLKAAGFAIASETDITACVLSALDLDNARKVAEIQRLVPKVLLPAFSDFAGIRGSKVYDAFLTGSLTYRSFVARKK